MGKHRSENPFIRRTVAPALVSSAVALACLAGCRTTEKDVHRWANTQQGPSRLVSVVEHDKYAPDLRVEAAVTLISMRPRAGQRVGIGLLVEALEKMPKAERARVLQGLTPRLVAAIQQAPVLQGTQRTDESVPFKDAGYALLTSSGGKLVEDVNAVQQLRGALGSWALTDFENRVDDPSQTYGVEQMMRWLGPESVRGLPGLITNELEKVDRIVALVADLGDEETKLRTSERLAARGRYVGSPAWRKAQESLVREQNEKAKLKPTPEQFDKQLAAYQEEQLLRLYATMKRIGRKPIVDYLLDEAQNLQLEEKRRATALAALEGNLDRRSIAQVDRLLAIATAKDTPDQVRDVALRRVGELPREQVVERLFGLFESDNWKIRWVAAELVLKMSDQRQIDEFMSRLGKVKHMAITEPLRYGALLADVKGKTAPGELAATFAGTRQPAPVRVSALGYFYEYGTAQDLDTIAAYASDREPVPGCPKDATDCEWKCAVEGELKEIETIGEFVEYCVKPAMQKRTEAQNATKRSNKKE
jgi:HEAT repeat protein